MVLDINNREFNYALDLVENTDKFIYLTGKAGTGKTTFLKHLVDRQKKRTIIVAPTGIAAINAGGVTIHSFFQIPLSPFVPKDERLSMKSVMTDGGEKTIVYENFKYKSEKLEIIRSLELLVIDEVSMVRCDLLDVIDQLLRIFRNKINQPFGGVQVLLIGDTFQLAPIIKPKDWAILGKYYESEFFFNSKIVESEKPIYIELKKIYRQNEKEFIDLLNRVRTSKLITEDIEWLDSRYNPSFDANQDDSIILATHNAIVSSINQKELDKLNGDIFKFEAEVTGNFPISMMPTDQCLHVKRGAQVMFIKNDTGDDRLYFNGKIGKISNVQTNRIEIICDTGESIVVTKDDWDNIEYEYDSQKRKVTEKVIGNFKQYPIKLAWAITVHKSQGLTFSKVYADLGGAFAPGQVYVALSRCTSMNGLILKTKIPPQKIKTDNRVIEFAKLETPSTLIVDTINGGKADKLYQTARNHFQEANYHDAVELLKQARTFRDDVDNDKFTRYLILALRRKDRLATQLANLKVDYDGLKEGYEIALLSHDKEIKELDKLFYKQKRKRKKVKAQNKKLKNEIQMLNNINYAVETEAKISNNSNNKRIDDLEKRLHDMKTEQDDAMALSNLEIKSRDTEINRLKSISWIQKLFGKK